VHSVAPTMPDVRRCGFTCVLTFLLSSSSSSSSLLNPPAEGGPRKGVGGRRRPFEARHHRREQRSPIKDHRGIKRMLRKREDLPSRESASLRRLSRRDVLGKARIVTKEVLKPIVQRCYDDVTSFRFLRFLLPARNAFSE